MDRGEAVREFYRRQGELRERDRIIALMENTDECFCDRGCKSGEQCLVQLGVVAFIEETN